MITPEFLEEITGQTEKTVLYMRTHILKRICDRIEASLTANQPNILIPSTITEIHQLMDSGMLIEEIQEEVEKALPHIKDEIKKAFYISAREISNYNTDIAKEIIEYATEKGEKIDIEIPQYERAGIPKNASNLNLTATEVRKLEQIYKGSTRMVENMCRLLPVQGNEMYLRLSTEGFLKAQSGIPIGDVITQAIKDANSLGISHVNYTSGHVDKIEVAVARAIRTAINKANSEIVLTRCAEMGLNYVKVSEHFGARVTKELDYTNHSWWQGKVYKLDWSNEVLSDFVEKKEEKGFKWLKSLKDFITKKFKKEKYNYPDFVETTGYGQMLGLSGVNCRHSFYPYLPDVQKDDKPNIDYFDNKEFYEKTQKQREMERRIRKTKSELYSLEGKEYVETLKRIDYLRNLLERQIEAYVEYCNNNNLKMENWRLQIYEGNNTKVSKR